MRIVCAEGFELGESGREIACVKAAGGEKFPGLKVVFVGGAYLGKERECAGMVVLLQIGQAEVQLEKCIVRAELQSAGVDGDCFSRLISARVGDTEIAHGSDVVRVGLEYFQKTALSGRVVAG